jgi:dephospho-CoA kinase
MSSSAASSPSESASPAPLRVGLTGGIGSGKSTVAVHLQQLGAALIDTDAIAHALTAPGGAAVDAIEQEFGAHFVTAAGAMDRALMREHVFANEPARRKLESILHPLIRERAQAAALEAAAHASYVVFAVPLLIESGNWRERVDRVLVIDCPPATQIERVQRRSSLPPETVRAIIVRQATRAARLRAADDVLVNDDTPDALQARCGRLHALYVSLATARRSSAVP